MNQMDRKPDAAMATNASTASGAYAVARTAAPAAAVSARTRVPVGQPEPDAASSPPGIAPTPKAAINAP